MLEPLAPLLYENLVRAALAEDLGRVGDITGNATIPAAQNWHAVLRTRKAGVVAGLDLARASFLMLDPSVSFKPLVKDGSSVAAGTTLAEVSGKARSLLAAERTALNFLCHLSGIATATNQFVIALAGTNTRICDTRKTTPGLRALEKYAVRAGGGVNHRFGLDDAVLIKDNHIAVAGGIAPVLAQIGNTLGHLVKVEIEVDTLAQVQELIGIQDSGFGMKTTQPIARTPQLHSVLLDNMSIPDMAEAVRLIAGRWTTVASGNVTLDRAAAIAATGVDLIASGAITHSSPIMDVGLDAVLSL